MNKQKKYKKLSANIESVNKLMHFCMVRLTLLGVVQPAFFVTVVNYFYFDLGRDSFYLPFPVMWGPLHSKFQALILTLFKLFKRQKKVTLRLACAIGIFGGISYRSGWIILYRLHGITNYMLCRRIMLDSHNFRKRSCKRFDCFQYRDQIARWTGNSCEKTLLR